MPDMDRSWALSSWSIVIFHTDLSHSKRKFLPSSCVVREKKTVSLRAKSLFKPIFTSILFFLSGIKVRYHKEDSVCQIRHAIWGRRRHEGGTKREKAIAQ